MIHFVQRNGRRYAQFERLRAAGGLVHAFATRPLDVAPRDGGDAAERAANRRRMPTDWGLDAGRLRYCMQVHQTRLTAVTETVPPGALEGMDGAATALVGVPLMTFSADCPLVLVHDPRRRVVGLAHASWRCTVGGIVGRLIELLRTSFGCDPANLQAAIGPGAGPCCYEVQEDVYAAAAGLDRRADFFPRRAGRMYFDLWGANAAQLAAAGVLPERIETAGVCTICGGDAFYSFRREGRGCGHFGLMAAVV